MASANKEYSFIDSRKLVDIQKWEKPKDGRMLAHQLGLLNYFRMFIPRYADIAAPLERLRNAKSIDKNLWGKSKDDTWNKLKNALMRAPILHFP
jgi:hypothetical protein